MIATTRTGRHAAVAMLLLAVTLLFASSALAGFICKPGWACNGPPSGCLNNAGCVPCPLGTHGIIIPNGKKPVCLPCSNGSISDSLGATSCKRCNYKGHTGYVSNAAHTACLKYTGTPIVIPPGLIDNNPPKFGETGPAGTGSPIGSGPRTGGVRSGGAGIR